MKKIEFENAFYIKLGRKGEWEKYSIDKEKIRKGKIRLGWVNQSLEDMNQRNWEKLKDEIREEMGNKGAATKDFNALRNICESTKRDIWITFYLSRMWWCRVSDGGIEKDNISKYRRVDGSWSDKNLEGQLLSLDQIPGKLSMLQGFRGTVCKVKETDTLRRLLNNERSAEYLEIEKSKKSLIKQVEKGIKNLHWKDFELLVDLLFRQTGWRRISVLGETMKLIDLELEEPITGDLYQVQVKSRASKNDFEKYVNQFKNNSERFPNKKIRKLYFVVHSPEKDLLNYQVDKKGNVELLLPDSLAKMTVSYGLVDWLLNNVR